MVFESADLPVTPTTDWILGHWQKARSLGTQDTLLAIDEIQKIPNWSAQVKQLLDEERRRRSGLRVVLLGSASWTLEQGLGDSLAGRFEVIRAHHWTLSECQELFGWGLKEFLKFGGYPVPAQFTNDKSRWLRFMQDSIVEPMLSKDIIPLKQIAKPALFRQAFGLAMSYPAQEISLNKMLGKLQESGNTTTLKNYLNMMSSGYALGQLEKYSTRPISQKASSPKLIPRCSALVHAFTDPDEIESNQEWFGRIFENAIGSHLLATFDEVFYWREANDEVDFVVKINKKVIPIEVKSGRKKSSKGISRFKAAFPAGKPIRMDLALGEKFLRAADSKGFLLELI